MYLLSTKANNSVESQQTLSSVMRVRPQRIESQDLKDIKSTNSEVLSLFRTIDRLHQATVGNLTDFLIIYKKKYSDSIHILKFDLDSEIPNLDQIQ